jgi:hypothetical protein
VVRVIVIVKPFMFVVMLLVVFMDMAVSRFRFDWVAVRGRTT